MTICVKYCCTGKCLPFNNTLHIIVHQANRRLLFWTLNGTNMLCTWGTEGQRCCCNSATPAAGGQGWVGLLLLQ